MFGDWLFSPAAFGERAPDPEGVLLSRFTEEVERLLADLGVDQGKLLQIRKIEIPKYLDQLVEESLSTGLGSA